MTSPSAPLSPPRAAGHRRSTLLTASQPPPLPTPRMSAALSSKPSQRSHASSGRALTTTTTTTSSSRFSQGPAAMGGQVGLFADLPSVWSEPNSSAAASGGGNIVLSDTAWPFGPPSQHRYVNPFKIGQIVVCPPAKKQKSAAQKLIDEVRKEKERERRRWEREKRRKKKRKKEKRARSRGKGKDGDEIGAKRVKHQNKKGGEEQQQQQQQQDQQPRQTKRQASMSSMATTIGTSSSPSSRSKLGASILSLARSKDLASSSKAWSIRSGTSRHMTSEEAQQRVAAAATATDQGDAAEYCDSTDPFPFRLSTSSGSESPQHRRSHSPRMSTALAQASGLVPALRRRDPVRRQGGFFAPLQQQLEQHEPDHPHYSDMTGGGLGASPSSQPLTPMTALHQSLLGSTGPQARTTLQKTMPRVGFLTRKGSIIRSSSDSAKSTVSISTTLSHVPGPHAATGGLGSSLLKPRQESLLSGSGGGPDRSRSSLGTISSSPGSTTRYSPTSPSKLSRSFSGEEVRSEVHKQLQHSPTPGQSNVVVFEDEQRGGGNTRSRPPITASSSWPTSLAAMMNDSPSAASNESSSAPGSGPEGTPSPLSLPLPLPSTAHSSASSSSSSSSASSIISDGSSHHHHSSPRRASSDEEENDSVSSSSSSSSSSEEESQLDAEETEWTGKVVDIYRCGLGTPFWIVVEGLQTQTGKVPVATAAAPADKGAAAAPGSEPASPRKWFKAAKAKAIGKGAPASPAATTTTTTTTKVVRREFDARFIRSAEEEKEELDEDPIEGQEKEVTATKKAYHQDDPIIVGPHARAASGNADDSGITLPPAVPPTLTSTAIQTEHSVKKQVRQHQRGRHSPPLVILQPSHFAKKSLSAPPLDEAGRGEGSGIASVGPPGGGGGSGQAGSLPNPQRQVPPPLPPTLPPARFTPFIRQRTSSLGCALDVARAGGGGQTQTLGRQPEVKVREGEREKEKEKDAHEDDSIVTSSAGASDERG